MNFFVFTVWSYLNVKNVKQWGKYLSEVDNRICRTVLNFEHYEWKNEDFFTYTMGGGETK